MFYSKKTSRCAKSVVSRCPLLYMVLKNYYSMVIIVFCFPIVCRLGRGYWQL